MDLNMEDLLLSGVHGDYKFCAVRLKLKDGEVEIGPPQRHHAGEDDAANIVLQVYNEFAHEVEIEYQPATKGEDTQWRFVCDGRVLKTIVPHKFWKTYLYPDEEHLLPRPKLVGAKPKYSNPPTSACSTRTTVVESNVYLIAEQKQGFQAPPSSPLVEAYTRNRQVSEQQDARPVLKVLQSNQSANTYQRTVGYTSTIGFGEQRRSEAAKKKKLRVVNTISQMNQRFTEKEFKVQCTRPVSAWNLARDVYSPGETYERVIKVKCYRPNSIEGRLQELTSNNKPCATPTQLLKAKFSLQSDQISSPDRKRYTGLQLLRQFYAREIDDNADAASPCSETEVASRCQLPRCPSSAQTSIDTATSPRPTSREKGESLSCARDAFVSDIHNNLPDKGSLLGYGQQSNTLTVGKVFLKDEHEVGPSDLWRTKCDLMSAATADLFKQGRSYGDVLMCVLEFIAKEKQVLMKQRRKCLKGKRRPWYRSKIENVWCACLQPNCRK